MSTKLVHMLLKHRPEHILPTYVTFLAKWGRRSGEIKRSVYWTFGTSWDTCYWQCNNKLVNGVNGDFRPAACVQSKAGEGL